MFAYQQVSSIQNPGWLVQYGWLYPPSCLGIIISLYEDHSKQPVFKFQQCTDVVLLMEEILPAPGM